MGRKARSGGLGYSPSDLASALKGDGNDGADALGPTIPLAIGDAPIDSVVGVCECARPVHGLTCRCACEKCGGRDVRWKAWGVYLDKDLVCARCGHVQDVWDC